MPDWLIGVGLFVVGAAIVGAILYFWPGR